MSNLTLMSNFTDILSWIQFRIDTTNHFFDSPTFDYQPIPWLGINSAEIRGNATVKRWQQIKKNIPKSSKSLKDIGSCVGYFCFSAAKECGLYSYGIDIDDRFLRIANYTRERTKINNVYFTNMNIDQKTAGFLPRTDITLCLSVWHHWVYQYGVTKATLILKKIWELTDKRLFFESGEEETAKEFNLPFTTKELARETIHKYLQENLKSSKVKQIGKFAAGNYRHYSIQNQKRTLFMVTKVS